METNKSKQLAERNLAMLERWLECQCHKEVAKEFNMSDKTCGDIIRAFCREHSRANINSKRITVPTLGLVFPRPNKPDSKYANIPSEMADRLIKTDLYRRLRDEFAY